MKKKAIIITSVIVAAIVCVVIVLCIIRSNQARSMPNGDLPIISDEGVRDIITTDTSEKNPDPTEEYQTEVADSDEISDILDISQNEDPELSTDGQTGEDYQDTTDEKPLDNNDTPIIIG